MNSEKSKRDIYKRIPLNKIDPPKVVDRVEIYQQTIDELAASIAEIGLLQPLLLNITGERFEVVFGHRRFLAAKKLGWSKIPARTVEYTPGQVSIARATENLQREGLTPMEEGRAYSRLVNELGLKVSEVSKKTGKSPGVIKRRIELLRMPESFQRALHAQKVSVGVAEELWSCPDSDHREYLLEMAVDHGITTIIARQWVQDFRKAVRKQTGDVEGEGQGANVSFDEKIYRSCGACTGPVELSQIKEIRCCPTCYDKLMKAFKGET